MVLVKISRRDKPQTISFTNTGLYQFIPDKEYFVFENGMFSDPIAVFLLYDKKWDMFSYDLHREISWYCRTFFNSSQDLDIRIKIK